MTETRPTGAGPHRSAPDMAGGEHAKLLESAVADQLDERLVKLRDHIVQAFPELEVLGFRGELTLIAVPDQLIDLLVFCRDDPDVRCELLADLNGVHWPGGKRLMKAEETTGWPIYETDQGPGRIEIGYILRSLEHNHWFRIRVNTPDDNPVVPSATGVYGSANVMEREAYDFFGVHFEGHPNLVRILNPDDWDGYPHRKDYPLGGVEVMYKGKTVPPPDERHY